MCCYEDCCASVVDYCDVFSWTVVTYMLCMLVTCFLWLWLTCLMRMCLVSLLWTVICMSF